MGQYVCTIYRYIYMCEAALTLTMAIYMGRLINYMLLSLMLLLLLLMLLLHFFICHSSVFMNPQLSRSLCKVTLSITVTLSSAVTLGIGVTTSL